MAGPKMIKHYEVALRMPNAEPLIFKAATSDCVCIKGGLISFDIICQSGLMGEVGFPVDNIESYSVHPVLQEDQ